MSYERFRAGKNKPTGKTSTLSPLRGQFALSFAEPGSDWPVALLDDYSSFDDLRPDLGIEGSWAESFSSVFPGLEPLAAADLDGVEEIDSYSEFLLLVDTASVARPVYWFSAESWSWDRWRRKQPGFTLLAASFDEFLASLVDFQGGGGNDDDDDDEDGDDDDDDDDDDDGDDDDDDDDAT